ncbi:MAG: DUF4129 domain-containing protein [Chloroflexi bacterium]|nr:DUF4129 domain-containing protein [Chloroflexota bacterium]
MTRQSRSRRSFVVSPTTSAFRCRPRTETPIEYALRLSQLLPSHQASIVTLANGYTGARFSPHQLTYGREQLEEAWRMLRFDLARALGRRSITQVLAAASQGRWARRD